MKPRRKISMAKIREAKRARYRKDYYALNRQHIIDKAVAHGQKNPERRREISLAHYHNTRETSPAKAMVAKSRSSAKKRGIEFTISAADIAVPAFCPVLGVPLKSHKGSPGPNSPSLDRVDSTKGYVPGNVWVISHRANQIKSDATPDELMRVADAVRRKLQGGE